MRGEHLHGCSAYPGIIMSRSRRKNPIFGHACAESEAEDKARWHRAFRRAENQRLSASPETEAHHFREFSSPWWMGKDGKSWWADAENNRHGGMRK